MDASQKWGLPPDFAPARFAIPDDAKNAVRAELSAGEPVIVSLSNQDELVTLLATPRRVLAVRVQEMGVNAGTLGVKSFPWDGIADITMRPQNQVVSLVIAYKTSDGGKTVEVGKRAILGKDKSDIFAPFNKDEGEAVFRALLQVWNWKKANPSGTE